jgi:hypothetical protein
MEVFKTHLYLTDDVALVEPYLIDTIFHQGFWWLVATWAAPHAGGARVPEVLVRLTGLSHEEVEGKPYRFFLHNPIPKAVLEGKEQAGYVVAWNQALVRSPAPSTKKPH